MRLRIHVRAGVRIKMQRAGVPTIALERPGAFCPNPVWDCPNPGLELIPVLLVDPNPEPVAPNPVPVEPKPPCGCGTVPPVCELETELKGVFILPG